MSKLQISLSLPGGLVICVNEYSCFYLLGNAIYCRVIRLTVIGIYERTKSIIKNIGSLKIHEMSVLNSKINIIISKK